MTKVVGRGECKQVAPGLDIGHGWSRDPTIQQKVLTQV